MKFWKTASRDVVCGRCAARIHTPEVYQTWKIEGVRTPKIRCQECAGEEPHDVDTHVEPLPPSLTFPRPAFVKVAAMARDFKIAQSGEREPGEDG